MMIRELIRGLGAFVAYYAVAASALLLLRVLLKPRNEPFRKMLHIACVLSVFVLLYAFETWYLSAAAALIFAAVVYVAILLLERHTRLLSLIPQRGPGEVRSSLVIVFVMMAILIAVFWGWLGAAHQYIVAVSIMAWGFGDAAAALVGKALGRHRIRSRWVEGPKTVEGSLAMLVVAAIAIFGSLLAYGVLPWYFCLLTALVVAPLCAVVELISHGGIDTITVPLATAWPVYWLVALFQAIGG